jgi:hypothetical protein
MNNAASVTTTEVEKLKRNFVEELRLSSAISDALKTRGGRRVFRKIVSDKETEEGKKERREQGQRIDEFREDLHAKLRGYAEAYTVEVVHEAHIKNIRDLAGDLTEKYKDILYDKELTFGVAQKALNVYLKASGVPTGRHCPLTARSTAESSRS